MLGEVAGSGYRQAPSLVRRADGQTIQLTPLLYRVLEEIDGTRDLDAVAAAVAGGTDWLLTADDIEFLVEQKLRPLGVLRLADGTDPAVAKANPLLALRLKLVVSRPTVTRWIAAPFAQMFRPPVVLAFLVAFVLGVWWVAFEHGLASAARQALYNPSSLLVVLALTTLSAAFHELGHAAACRYGGAKPGAMGVGLYLVWPAFYTDVTDSYRLGRGGRLRVDLGGLYFNAVFAVAVLGAWAFVRIDALLLVVAAQIVQMVRQLTPLVRFDGYHVLADLTGVPDLFLHIRPTLLGLLPGRRGRHLRGGALRPWARAVVTVWVAVRRADPPGDARPDSRDAAANRGHRLGQPRAAVGRGRRELGARGCRGSCGRPPPDAHARPPRRRHRVPARPDRAAYGARRLARHHGPAEAPRRRRPRGHARHGRRRLGLVARRPVPPDRPGRGVAARPIGALAARRRTRGRRTAGGAGTRAGPSHDAQRASRADRRGTAGFDAPRAAAAGGTAAAGRPRAVCRSSSGFSSRSESDGGRAVGARDH